MVRADRTLPSPDGLLVAALSCGVIVLVAAAVIGGRHAIRARPHVLAERVSPSEGGPQTASPAQAAAGQPGAPGAAGAAPGTAGRPGAAAAPGAAGTTASTAPLPPGTREGIGP